MKNFRANVVLTPATVVLCLIVLAPIACAQGGKFEREVRARDLGVPFEGTPGPLDAITDVKGVEVGYRTLISGDGKLVVGTGPVRTGVTAVFSRAGRVRWIRYLRDGSRKMAMGK